MSPSTTADAAPRMVVGIGASAGGVEALLDLVDALPVDFPAAIVVVLHRRTRHELPRILDRAGVLPVRPIADGDLLRAGLVHVAADERDVYVGRTRLALGHAPTDALFQPSIDVMLASLAQTWGAQSVCVLMSGMLDDGVRGAQEVYARGGRALVQSPEEATHPSMPLNAIMRDHPEDILPAGAIASRLAEMARDA